MARKNIVNKAIELCFKEKILCGDGIDNSKGW